MPNFFYSFLQLHLCFGNVLKMCYLHISHDTESISSDHHLRCDGWLNLEFSKRENIWDGLLNYSQEAEQRHVKTHTSGP